MPYFITDEHPDCSNWAVVKEDGELLACHDSQESATEQMIAVSLSEEVEPGGTYNGTFERNEGQRQEARDLPEAYRPANSEDVPEGRACGNCIFYREEQQNDEGLSYCERWEEYVRGDYYCDSWQSAEEERKIEEIRQVDLDPPAYMRAAARRGLRFYEEGLGGDGLTSKTVSEARAMAAGNVTADKWVRIAAWIARHMDDLDAPAANPSDDNFPSAGVVAHLLWGSGVTKRAAERTMGYAEGVVRRLEEENRSLVSVEAKDMAKIETRLMVSPFEVREEGNGMTFSGYAAIFNSASEPLPFTERIAPGAFKRSLRARNDIKLLWNHDTGSVLGSTRANTLRLEEDSYGLRVTADLPDTQQGRDAAYLIKRGDVSAMSFGFSVPRDGDEWSRDGMERTLTSVRLHEVSIVAYPAYNETSGKTMVRNLDLIAKRANVNIDDLSDAILKIETGENLTPEDAEVLTSVIKDLSPEEEKEVENAEPELNSDMLELKKKKLQQLLKGI